MDASLLRWWDGSAWGKQTMPADLARVPADLARVPANPASPTPLGAVPPLLSAVPPVDEPYVPPNSVFRMAETAGEAYTPEWSALAEISPEVALSGVPVQLALTSTPSEPPIPVSADAFPILGPNTPVAPTAKESAWQVAEPLAAPVDQLFPVAPVAAAAIPVVAAAIPVVAAAIPVVEPATPTVAPVPAPAGQLFPGLVPSSEAPPVAPVAPVAALPLYAEPPAPEWAVPAPAPVAAPVPVAAPAPTAEPALYAGPAPVEFASAPMAASDDVQPFAASTPGAGYVPLVARPIPQPAMLAAPVPAPALAPLTTGEPAPSLGTATPMAPAEPSEYWPTQAAPRSGAQPGPGDYVPFDPNAVQLQPVPMIPFSSRDPFSSASTARPGMRTYAAAPVGPSGSTWTGGLAFMLLAPVLTAAAFFIWSQLTAYRPGLPIAASTVTWLPLAWAGIGLLTLAAAQIDRNALARRGYFDLASPFWVLLLPPLVYLIVRATRLHGQGRGGAPAIALWAIASIAGGAALGFVGVSWITAATPERVVEVQNAIVAKLAAGHVAATAQCPSVPGFAVGTTFVCSVTGTDAAAGSTAQIEVTVTDLSGSLSFVGLPKAPAGTSTS